MNEGSFITFSQKNLRTHIAIDPDENLDFECLNVAQKFFKDHYGNTVNSTAAMPVAIGMTTIAHIATRQILDKGGLAVVLAPQRELINNLVQELG
ncbi:MAG: hypothetical protein ACLQF0_06905 [Dissulfurispiraceae bacterium]